MMLSRPDEPLNRLDQHVTVVGLGQKDRRPVVEEVANVGAIGGDENDRHVGGAVADAPADFTPVGVRQMEIDDDDVRHEPIDGALDALAIVDHIDGRSVLVK